MESDETTKGTQGDPVKATSEPKTGTTSEKTYTEKEIQKLISDERAAAGRKQTLLAKELEVTKGSLKEINDQLLALSKEREETELKSASGDPELLRVIRTRAEVRAEQANLAKTRRELEELKTRIEADKQEINSTKISAAIAETAVRHHLSIADFENEVKELGITDPDKFDRVAQRLTGKTAEVRPDSGRGTGGGLTPAQVRKQYGEGQISSKEYAEKMEALGHKP